MADAENTTGHPALQLEANSYDLHALEKATLHAESLKTEEGRKAAFDRIASEQALNSDVVKSRNGIAVPEGHELREIEDMSGRNVLAPVPIAPRKRDDEAVDVDPLKPETGRRGQADTTKAD